MIFLFAACRSALPATAAPDPWANPFCAGLVTAMPWDAAGNRPAARLSSDRYFLQLTADGKTDVAATVTFITATDAYSVTIPRTPLLRVGGTDSFYAAPVLVALDKPVDVHYAFVDQIGLDGAAPAACPTYVQSVEPFAADGSNGVPGVRTDVAPIRATYLQALPTLTCGKVYTPPDTSRNHSVSGYLFGNGYGSERRTVTYTVYIDSNGVPSGAKIEQSSGVDGIDETGLGAVEHTRYTPATFLCTPVVSAMRIRLTYNP